MKAAYNSRFSSSSIVIFVGGVPPPNHPRGVTSLFAPPGTPSAFFVRSLPEPKLLSGQSPGSDLDSYEALGFALCDLYFVEALLYLG